MKNELTENEIKKQTAENLLEIKGLKTYFKTERGTLKAADGVSFSVKKGETVCVVGESGCGKSVTSLSIMRLLDKDDSASVKGKIIFNNKDILEMSEEEIRKIRGKDISMIFQNPMSSLNPVLTIGNQIIESLMLHEKISKKDAGKRAVKLLKEMGIQGAENIMKSYPHELSGGMRQRVMIAMAVCCNPKVLIADEPTTALDVTIQAQILDILRKLKEDSGMSVILITHDLGVVAEMADYVVVMYAGKVVEEGNTIEIFKNTLHPYTKGLLKSKPVIYKKQETLYSIPGQVPELINLPEYCYFSDRCEKCMDICRKKQPPQIKTGENHKVSCWLYADSMAAERKY